LHQPNTLAAEALLEGEAERLTRKCIELALSGDSTALRLCLERIYPARKDRPVTFALPSITSPRDAADIAAAVAQAAAEGRLTPGEAGEFAKVIDVYVRAYQTAELDHRVALGQLTDAELLWIASGGRATETSRPRLLTVKAR
jgi:hypothetical protein